MARRLSLSRRAIGLGLVGLILLAGLAYGVSL